MIPTFAVSAAALLELASSSPCVAFSPAATRAVPLLPPPPPPAAGRLPTTATTSSPPRSAVRAPPRRRRRVLSSSSSDVGDGDRNPGDGRPLPAARVEGPVPPSEAEAADLRAALNMAGFRTVELGDPVGEERRAYRYVLSKATGMLKMIGGPAEEGVGDLAAGFDAPRWVPIVRGEENVLVANGWSFLDPDESEPNSAFDVDAANAEGLYRPKWGQEADGDVVEADGDGVEADAERLRLSSLGYDLRPMSSSEVLAEAESVLGADARSVLLDGATDPPGVKRTSDGWDFSGRAGRSDVPRGIFACAVGGLPLFSTADLAPTTASSGWLSFVRPLSDDHVVLVPPEDGADDRRVEVVCARSRCHLGHYFGRGEGYCINASALNFLPAPAPGARGGKGAAPSESRPLSWRALAESPEVPSPSDRVLRDAMLPPSAAAPWLGTAVLGAGCFWHVEAALRRLPGVVSTEVGYAGGSTSSPTYERVCKSSTGHAEVVRVEFDVDALPPRMLFGCFLAMHDPTKVRAHGKHAAGTGQYRSCAFVSSPGMESIAREALDECGAQLGRELRTEVRLMPDEDAGGRWFWRAEDRHQRRNERFGGRYGAGETSTLSVREWLREYGRRSKSVWGSGETVQVAVDEPGDDGMAMMMI